MPMGSRTTKRLFLCNRNQVLQTLARMCFKPFFCLIGLTGTERERAVGFLAAIRALNASLGIPDRFDGIRGEDLPRMAAWAAAEANPVYPVPVVYDQARFRRVLERLRA